MDSKRTVEVRVTQVSPFLESYAELERHFADARELRARALAEMLGAACRAVARTLGATRARLARRERRRQTYEALAGCSDRVLADIGIARDDIASIARGTEPGNDAGTAGWWRGMRTRLRAWRRERRHWRRVRRELMAYRDRELDDLGIRRSDIPAVARGREVARAGE